jgi:hypothetical protein
MCQLNLIVPLESEIVVPEVPEQVYSYPVTLRPLGYAIVGERSPSAVGLTSPEPLAAADEAVRWNVPADKHDTTTV